ncbi:MAG: hypothetical protein ACI4PM_02985 [Butyricicoccus sp.]
MKTQHKYARRYIRSVLRTAPCSFHQKRCLRSKLRSILQQYNEENPDSTYEDLEQAFGPAEEFAKELLPANSFQQTQKFYHRRKCLKYACISVVFCCIFGLGAKTLYWENLFRTEKEDALSSYATIEEREIEINSKADIDNMPPSIEKYQYKYSLSYELVGSEVVKAEDEDLNPVSVDKYGKPLDQDYPVSDFYEELPDE